MLVGPPNSGKSVHLKVTKGLLGPKNMAHKTLKEVVEHNSLRLTCMANLQIHAQTYQMRNSKKDIEAFKLISSGDDVDVEKKNRDPFTFVPFAKLMYSAKTVSVKNHLFLRVNLCEFNDVML